MAERPTPASCSAPSERAQAHRFLRSAHPLPRCSPSPDSRAAIELALRVCTSAGEPCRRTSAGAGRAHFGVEILDGIGSTEMLHIFISATGPARCATAPPASRSRDTKCSSSTTRGAVAAGEIGELLVSGPTCAGCYWNNRAKTRGTFKGPWTRSGDKYSVDADGYYVYGGRSDDMLKVSGLYVSPLRWSRRYPHPRCWKPRWSADRTRRPDQADGVRGAEKPGTRPMASRELKEHVKSALAPYKYPRWIEFLEELPKTATGKIQRFKLREPPP